VQLWQRELAASGGPFLFGPFGITDAYYAPVLSRLRTYALPLPADIVAYSGAVFATEAVTAWCTTRSSNMTSSRGRAVSQCSLSLKHGEFLTTRLFPLLSFRLRCHFDRRRKILLLEMNPIIQPYRNGPHRRSVPAFMDESNDVAMVVRR